MIWSIKFRLDIEEFIVESLVLHNCITQWRILSTRSVWLIICNHLLVTRTAQYMQISI